MTKEKIIEILEDFKPDSGYCCRASYEEFANERVNNRLDDIIEFIKREPDDDNKWIKCSEKMPEPMRQVLFYDERFKECAAGYYNKNYNAIQVGCALLGINDEYERFTHWMPLPSTEGLDDAT